MAMKPYVSAIESLRFKNWMNSYSEEKYWVLNNIWYVEQNIILAWVYFEGTKLTLTKSGWFH